MQKVNIAIIGCGTIALANHLPGITMCQSARLVALCDNNPVVLAQAGKLAALDRLYSDYQALLGQPNLDAVIVTAPNFAHAPVVLAAVKAGKHVLCEKPLALDYQQSLTMLKAAEAAGVRHMTAFTYRFVPAMHYMSYLVGQGAIGAPYHFRANRFQDWGDRGLGWRQSLKLAGSGELGDMLSHRIDYAHLLVGQTRRVVAQTRQYLETRGGQPADVDDYVSMLAEYSTGATGVLESSKMATGRGEGARSQDYCEVNGSEGTLVYMLNRPHELQVGRKGGAGLETVPVPEEFLKWPGSPRDPHQGDPLVTFRYDQDWEFIDAIQSDRPCQPSFKEGVQAQAVMEAVLESGRRQSWIEVNYD